MLALKIASRYAEALFDIAQQKGQTEKWEQELASLATLLDAMPELREVLTHPEIPYARKEKLMRRGKVAPDIMAMLFMLLKRGHDPDIAAIHKVFLDLWNKARLVLPVRVTSATSLSESQALSLSASLAKQTGAKIQLHQEIDDSLIAGMVITIGDRVIDASAQSALNSLRAAMSGT